MMLELRKLVFWLFVLCMSSAAFAAGDTMAGVWRLRSSDPEIKRPVHLVVTSDQGKVAATYFNESWQGVKLVVEEVGEKQIKARGEDPSKLVLELTRTGEQSAGTIGYVHPQFPTSDPVSGFRVLSAPNWEPLEGLRRHEDQDHLVDLNGILAQQASKNSLSEFSKRFESEVAADFYCFLEEQLYGDSGLLQPKLKELFELVRKPEFRAAAEKFARLRKEVAGHLKKELPAFSYANMTLTMPASAGFSLDTGFFLGDMVIRSYVSPSLREIPDKDLKLRLLREQIRLPLFRQFPPGAGGLAGDIIRDGISGYMAASLLKLKVEDVTGVPNKKLAECAPRLESHRRTIAPHLRAEVKTAAKLITDPALSGEQVVQVVIFQFGELIAQRFKPEEVVEMHKARLMELLVSYLKGA
jgi:hypothetical protein